MIDIDCTIGAIFLGPQYNLKGGYLFDILMKVKCLRRSHWNLANMTEDVIERYGNFNTKDSPEELIFGDFNNQSIPSTNSDFINNYDDDGT